MRTKRYNIKFDKEIKLYNILTTDIEWGKQLIAVEQIKDNNWLFEVVTNDPTEKYDLKLLEKGTKYIVLDNIVDLIEKTKDLFKYPAKDCKKVEEMPDEIKWTII